MAERIAVPTLQHSGLSAAQRPCHVNQTLDLKKRALSAFDDKKYILGNGVETLSYGHYKISDEVILEGDVVQ